MKKLIPNQNHRVMKYKVHRFNISMRRDKNNLEQFLNSLKGEVISIVPNVTFGFFFVPIVDFLLITEKRNNEKVA